MLACPNKDSEDWKRLLAEANGNEQAAFEAWLLEQDLLDDGTPDTLTFSDETEDFAEEAEAVTKEEEETDPRDFGKLVDSVILYLEKQYATLQNKVITNKEYKKKELRKRIEEVKAAEGVKSIYLFVDDAYEKSRKASLEMAYLLKNKDRLDPKEVIGKLSAINDFINGYSILDEISKADLDNYFTPENIGNEIPGQPLTPQQKIIKIRGVHETIKQKVLTEGIPLIADFLLEYKGPDITNRLDTEMNVLDQRISDIQNSNLSDEKKAKRVAELEERKEKLKSFNLDREGLIKMLQVANKDEDVFDFLVGPLISSHDAPLGLFAKAVKGGLEEARLKDIIMERTVSESFEEYLRTQGNRDNPAKFNEGVYETIEIPVKDKDGKIEYVKTYAFVQKYDVTKFNKARNQMLEEIGEEPILDEKPTFEQKQALKAWRSKRAAWYRKNTQAKPISEINKIIEEKQLELSKRIITDDEYADWLKSVKHEKNGVVTYMRELSEPSNAYLNSNWTALYNLDGTPKNAKGEYHKKMLDIYLAAQEKLPEVQRKGYILPSIVKTDGERLQQEGLIKTVKTKAKEAVKIQAYDTEYGLAGLGITEAKFIPVYYTQIMPTEDMSLNIARSVMLFDSMANRYESLNKINSEISLFQTIIGDRQVLKTNSLGKPVLDAFAKKLGYEEYIKKNGENYSQKHVDAFIDMVVYGEMQKSEQLFGLQIDKIVNNLMGYSAITTIAADLLKGVANNMQANIQVMIEANSAEFFNKKNFMKGKAYYSKSVPGFISDFSKSAPTNLATKLFDYYDAIQGNFKDQYGRNITGSMANKLFSTNTLFFNQFFGEHEVQGSTMFALMDATKVLDNENGEIITLLEAHQKYGVELDGKIKILQVDANQEPIKDDTGEYIAFNYDEKQRLNFQSRLHALNKRMHGVYNEFDKGTAQRGALGRVLLMYRKHLVPAYKKRWKRLGMDQELGAPTEGYYITFWNTFVRDLRDYKFNVMKNWSTYSPFEKAQIRRVIAETTIILAAFTLAMILKSMMGAGVDDDDLTESQKAAKDNFVYNFVLYEAVRMRSETSQYLPVLGLLDAYRVVKSPSAMTGTLDRAIKFTDQFLLTWNPEKLQYQKDTGVWKKGDNKSWAYFLKLMGYSGYNFTPAEAVKSFESTFFTK